MCIRDSKNTFKKLANIREIASKLTFFAQNFVKSAVSAYRPTWPNIRPNNIGRNWPNIRPNIRYRSYTNMNVSFSVVCHIIFVKMVKLLLMVEVSSPSETDLADQIHLSANVQDLGKFVVENHYLKAYQWVERLP